MRLDLAQPLQLYSCCTMMKFSQEAYRVRLLKSICLSHSLCTTSGLSLDKRLSQMILETND
jgi:hypothetical protein